MELAIDKDYINFDDLERQFQIPRTHLTSVINGRHPREDIIKRISEYLGIDTP